jgi:hypothetical protein
LIFHPKETASPDKQNYVTALPRSEQFPVVFHYPQTGIELPEKLTAVTPCQSPTQNLGTRCTKSRGFRDRDARNPRFRPKTGQSAPHLVPSFTPPQITHRRKTLPHRPKSQRPARKIQRAVFGQSKFAPMLVVEAAGIEPASREGSNRTSTLIAVHLIFRFPPAPIGRIREFRYSGVFSPARPGKSAGPARCSSSHETHGRSPMKRLPAN